MKQVGDIIEQKGIQYRVGHVIVEEAGTNLYRRGVRQTLGLTRLRGKAVHMASVFENGQVGTIVSVGGSI